MIQHIGMKLSTYNVNDALSIKEQFGIAPSARKLKKPLLKCFCLICLHYFFNSLHRC